MSEIRLLDLPSVDDIPGFAERMKTSLNGRPELILAEDHRSSGAGFVLRYIFELDGRDEFVVASVNLPEEQKTFPSLATQSYLASLFEREIHDLFGLKPEGHPDLRRLPLHQFWPAAWHPLLKDAPDASFADDGTPFPFRQVEGEGTFEITVGPVHAGIIEPGHFRFSVEGETIVNLESRLYFVHKGIEKQFEKLSLAKAVELAERISGDSSFGHALAFCMAAESSAGVEVPERASVLRVVFLELERLYNHIGDTGAICTDTGFSLAYAHCMRLREDLLRLNRRLTGHRLLRSAVVPGGLSRNISHDQLADVREEVARIAADFSGVVEMALANSLVLDRLHDTGVLTEKTAREMQVCGLAARASGIDRDVRRDHPFAAYARLNFSVPVFSEGDVWARMMVRVEEARQSEQLIAQCLDNVPPGPIAHPLELPEGATGFGLVEGWRGPIWHWIATGPNGRLQRVKIKDPSFSNWPAISYAILKNIVPDFPLINKSFNLSYAGNDL